MTTLNVNEGASSSAGSHNELSSLLPTSSEPAINPTTESLQQNQTSLSAKNGILEPGDTLRIDRSRTRGGRLKHRHVK